MKKRAKICFYIFIACAVFALGILGYFVFNNESDNVMIGSRKFVTFNEVPGAVTYSLSVENNSQNYVANYKVRKSATENPNEYSFLVEVTLPDNTKIAEENYLQEITSQNKENNTIDCIIKDYTVDFFNTQNSVEETRDYVDQTLIGVNKNSLFCIFSEYFESVFVEDGKYVLNVCAFNEDGNKIENSEKAINYNYYAYYERDFERRENYFINGDWYNYVITNKEELKLLVWHTILYRNNNVTFFVKTPNIHAGNINSLVYEAISTYPEYDAVEDAGSYAKMQEKVGTLQNFTYYLDSNFTKTYEDLALVDAAAYIQASDYLYKKDADYCDFEYIKEETSSPRNFEIDKNDVDEVMVYNTEQLYMVVQYGARPIFPEGESVAKTVYENAKSELAQINNSDNLTDYEKALNIYRYICSNVIYDYVTYEFMYIKDDYTISSFGNYSCFYLEGVFYNLEKQYAVCDGLAKAYSLMCSIEGVDCIKVNGRVIGEGNHAWNKVYLVDAEHNLDDWYCVDTTWGVASYSSFNKEQQKTEYFEILTHTYFLNPEYEGRQIHYQAGVEDCVSDFNVYEILEYSFEDKSGDFYIQTNNELIEAFDYVEYLIANGDNSVTLEIYIDKIYANEYGSEIKDFKLNNTHRNSLQKELNNAELYGNEIEVQKLKNQIAGVNQEIRDWFTQNGVSNTLGLDWFIIDDVIIFRFFVA